MTTQFFTVKPYTPQTMATRGGATTMSNGLNSVNRATYQHSIKPLLIVLFLFLSACSTQLPRPEHTPPLATNIELQQWQLRGKIGIRNGKHAHSAYLNWQQCGQHFNIRLTGPLGQTAAHLYGDNQRVTLQTPDQLLQAHSPEQLLEQQLGWTLPVLDMVYWLRGIPSPQQNYQPDDTNNDFQQNGWQLSYPRFSDVNGHQLPAKIIAEQAPFKVTLIIKQWQLEAKCEAGR